jgi:hypothetical protein
VGSVHEGVLGNIWVLAPAGRASWPRHLEIRAWSYLDDSGAEHPTRTRSYSVAGPSIEEMVADLERRAGSALPPEYREFLLKGSKPRRRRGVELLRASQVYLLDEPPAAGATLAIGDLQDGSMLGLRLADGAVVGFDVDSRPHVVAPSFAAWRAGRRRSPQKR